MTNSGAWRASDTWSSGRRPFTEWTDSASASRSVLKLSLRLARMVPEVTLNSASHAFARQRKLRRRRGVAPMQPHLGSGEMP